MYSELLHTLIIILNRPQIRKAIKCRFITNVTYINTRTSTVSRRNSEMGGVNTLADAFLEIGVENCICV